MVTGKFKNPTEVLSEIPLDASAIPVQRFVIENVDVSDIERIAPPHLDMRVVLSPCGYRHNKQNGNEQKDSFHADFSIVSGFLPAGLDRQANAKRHLICAAVGTRMPRVDIG